MINLGAFHVIKEEKEIEVDIAHLNIGVNNLNNHFIKLNENREIEYVIDKVCDHAGGKLILKKDKAICPKHAWSLNLDTLTYNNSHERKRKSKFHYNEKGNLILKDSAKHLRNPFSNQKEKGDLLVRWLNHATVYIEANGISLITDPWLFGPAFLTGWWLEQPSTKDSVELLKSADFVYISHNHPDHLHPETLALLNKDTPIIVANFQSKSSEKYLKALGYSNITALEFNDIVELTANFQISILKSGDFRDDSGIYLNVNGNELLLTVDSNFLNSNVLPKNIDLLMTSFAGGATGFPLCYENYSLEEKTKILKRTNLSVRSSVVNSINASKPKYYMPYAGMFKEYASRDLFIKDNNRKNTSLDYSRICSELNVGFIPPKKNQILQFKNGEVNFLEIEVDYLEQENTDFYISEYQKEYQFSSKKIIDYLRESGYEKKQILQIIPTDDTFENSIGEIVYADFYNQVFKVIPKNELVHQLEDYKVMKLKVRSEIIACVIENKLPWEDFSIGFQMRVERQPNEYESDFWYHFTNNYINEQHFRYSPYCGSCTVINQNPIWNKKKSSL